MKEEAGANCKVASQPGDPSLQFSAAWEEMESSLEAERQGEYREKWRRWRTKRWVRCKWG